LKRGVEEILKGEYILIEAMRRTAKMTIIVVILEMELI
jgi:uncharacterized membrane protein